MFKPAVWAAGVAAVLGTTGATAPAADPQPKPIDAPAPPPGFPKFRVQEIETGLKIGYAVLLDDLNGDKKPDIVVVDQHRVVWYENPSWKRRTILQGQTKPDNVCAAALDIDRDGQLDLVLGAGWGAGSKVPATLQWLKRGKSLDDPWTLYPIPCDEPTVHRVRAADTDGDGKPEIVVVPLQGRDASAKGNRTDGRPVRIVAYPVPDDPAKGPWTAGVLSDSLHVVHNFWPTANAVTGRPEILAASYEGVSLIDQPAGRPWRTQLLHRANQDNPKGSRGASEIKAGRMANGTRYIGTVEPWHGNQVVVYTPDDDKKEWSRQLLDAGLRWGHAVWCADLDGDGLDELVIGVRDDPNPKQGDAFTDRRGVRVYKTTDGRWKRWDRYLLENGGVAVEDLACADLDGDGRTDIVAVGRQTGNARIYWNKGK